MGDIFTVKRSSSRERIVIELARGGWITADRSMPFPHVYTLHLAGDRRRLHGDGGGRIEEAEAQRLVDLKLIAGRATDSLWDHIEFRPSDNARAAFRAAALEYHPSGCGDCPTCGALLKLGKTSTAPRHGYQRVNGKEVTPPCVGSGKPMVAVIRPTPEAAPAEVPA